MVLGKQIKMDPCVRGDEEVCESARGSAKDVLMSKKAVRIAMWSGPRNISTAMMRSFENRGDCAVVDEPFYAHYLARTGLDHPARDEVIAAGETDWHDVVAMLTGPVPGGRTVFYQKHMTHHMLPHIGHEWFADVAHVFLIRDPREVLA